MGRFRLVSQSDVCLDTSGPSSPTLAALFSALRLIWRDSILRIVVTEIRRLPLRIVASQNRTNPKSQVAIPLAPSVDSDSFLLNHNFARACADCILEQSALCPWLAELDLEKLGLAFQMGAQWTLRTQGNLLCDEVRQSSRRELYAPQRVL